MEFKVSNTVDRDSVQTWVKPLNNGDWAVCFVNRSANAKMINFNWQSEDVRDTLFNKQLNSQTITYKVHDLWSKKDLPPSKKELKAIVQPHDVLLLRLTK